MLSLPLFFYALLNFLIPPPCLPVSFSLPKCHSQYSFRCFFSISAVLSHSSVNLSLPPSLFPSVSIILFLVLLSLPFFPPYELFCLPPEDAALRHTHSLLPYNRTFSSSSSFCTSHNLLGYIFLRSYMPPCVHLFS